MRLPIQSAALIRPMPGDPGPMMMVQDGAGTMQAIACQLVGVEFPTGGAKFRPRRVYRAVVIDDEQGIGQSILAFYEIGYASRDYWAADPQPVQTRPPAAKPQPEVEDVEDHAEA